MLEPEWSLDDPISRFRTLLDEAKALPRERLPEPTAFSLGTVGKDGQPAVRIMLLKGVDEHGFVFYTNYESRKGSEILAHPKVAMCFHWQPLERQVRVEGIVDRVTNAEADAYFASRARESQVGAWASRQSRAMTGPEELERRVAELTREFEGRDVPRPPHWSGFRVAPRMIEFWRAMPGRLHQRQRYVRADEAWRREWVYP